jgi:hypothetical protein
MKHVNRLLLASLLAMPLLAENPNKIFAQKLVDQAIARHPELVVLMMHVTPPGKADNVVIASNIGRIRKKGDEDDLRCIQTGKSNLEVSPKGDHFEVELVLQDASGKTVGALGTVFNYKPGDDKAAFDRKAQLIRNELRDQIPTIKKLFEPIP